MKHLVLPSDPTGLHTILSHQIRVHGVLRVLATAFSASLRAPVQQPEATLDAHLRRDLGLPPVEKGTDPWRHLL